MIKNIDYNYIKKGSKTIVLLHGWGMDKSSFDELVHFFSKNYSVLTIDFLGFGKSDDVEEYYDTYEYAYQIFLLLSELQIGDLYLVGHSFGGRISILLSSVFDLNVKGLILTSSAGAIRFSLVKKIKILNYKLLKKLANIGLVKNDLLNKYGSDDYKKLDTKMKQVFIKIVNQDLCCWLCKITCMSYLVWDKKDDVTPYWICKKFSKLLCVCKIINYREGGHYVCFFNKIKFANLCNEMIENDTKLI